MLTFTIGTAIKKALAKWPQKDQRAENLLSNYAVALAGARKWQKAQALYEELTRQSSPPSEVLLNYAIFLSEKSKRERAEKARQTLLRAKGLTDELSLSARTNRLKRKSRLLSKSDFH